METDKNSEPMPADLTPHGESTPTTESTPPTESTPQKESKPLEKPKKRCTHRKCTSLPLRFAGHCPHCNTNFCGNHRLPEAHECAKMDACRQEAFNKNKTRLESERTVASKMAVA